MVTARTLGVRHHEIPIQFKRSNKKECETGSVIWYGECSYIKAVKWDVFINNYSVRIEKACEKQDNIDNYEICKEV